MTEAEYTLYRETVEATDRLPPASAIAFVEQLAAQNSESEAVLSYLAVFLSDRGRLQDASTICRRVLAKTRSASGVAAESYRQLMLGDRDSALLLAQESVLLDASNPLALMMASAVFVFCEKYDEALTLAKRRIEHDHKNPEAFNGILRIFINRADFSSLRSTLADAPQAFTGTSDFHCVLGHLAGHERRLDDALNSFAAASEMTPFRPMPLVYLASTQFKLKRIQEAKTYVYRALELSPHNGAALSLAMRIAENTNDVTERQRLRLERIRHSGATKAYLHGDAADEFLKAGMPVEALRAIEMMERDGEHLAKRVATLKKLGPLADLGRWKELERTLSQLGNETLNPDPIVTAKARLAARNGDVNGALEQLEASFHAAPKNGSVLRWLLIFASEQGRSSTLERLVIRWREEFDESDSEAIALIAGLYAVKAFELGDKYLCEELARCPNSARLAGAECWRLTRIGDTATADRIRRGLPIEFKYWRPPASLRPPKQSLMHVVGRQLRRRFFRR